VGGAPSQVPKYSSFINGEYFASEGADYYEDINPATSEVIGYIQRASIDEVKYALESAEKAFEIWSRKSFTERVAVLSKASQIFKNKKDELARLLTIEQGKTLSESKKEVDVTIRMFEFFASEVGRLTGEFDEADRRDLVTFYTREPLGVVLVLTPWNYPLSIPAWKIAPALVAGNTVVFKPASYTPIIGLKLVEILHQAGLPNGAINCVTASGSAIGDLLVKDKRVQAITFTGSTEVGQRIAALASQHLARVQLEMGGKNACVVLDDANLDVFMDGFLSATFGVAGQKCTATSRLIVTKNIKKQVLDRIIKLCKKIKVGNGLREEVDVGPVVSSSQMETVIKFIESGKRDGAKVIAGGERLTGPEYDKGFFIAPTVFDDATPDMEISQEEIFGPVLTTITVENYDEAVEAVNNCKYGLSASIFTNSLSKAMSFIRDAKVGITLVNMHTNYNEPHMPFGGIKMSGFGLKEQGRRAIDFFTEIKSAYIRP
jgi:acyl-CoA reductase-like NAD-dependent aldehyde dehydrogenase